MKTNKTYLKMMTAKSFKLLAVLMMAVMCIVFSSCSEDDKVGSDSDLIGKWKLTWMKGWEIDSDGEKEEWDQAGDADGVVSFLVFHSDGTVDETYYEVGYEEEKRTYTYTWELNGNKLTFDNDVYTVETLNKSTLKLTMKYEDGEDTGTFKKVD